MADAGRYSVKVYVVQQADAEGKLSGEVIAAKLTHGAAHAIAKKHAPAKVTCLLADKGPEENGPEYTCDQRI